MQQGMNAATRSRRAATIGTPTDVNSFVDEPHSAIDGPDQGEIVNLADQRAAISQIAQLDLLTGLGHLAASLLELAALSGEAPAQALLPRLIAAFTPRCPVQRRSRAATVRDPCRSRPGAGPVDFPELLLIHGVGARARFGRSPWSPRSCIRAPYRFRDPARFSLAHGGKDRHPYPVPLGVAARAIRVMKSTLGAQSQARAGRRDAKPAAARPPGAPCDSKPLRGARPCNHLHSVRTSSLARSWREISLRLGKDLAVKRVAEFCGSGSGSHRVCSSDAAGAASIAL